MQQAQEFLDEIENKLDALVANADEDTLFTSGYLRGHIMLAAGYLENDNKMTIDNIISATNDSLEKAIAAGELSDEDQVLVKSLWASLL
ncbi:YfcL family protein [Catenovulum maritimum]|uniref:YfcL protein n=1 Tax=Catenovulum maritimum TaxID=1513271 RepID=A0A0J8GWQ8_9ALTE|nr:YfcL family protein [Catenovulum maritimum]KMT65113.1 hypothetical protein XM47_10260 [Catenovulum maritimum]